MSGLLFENNKHDIAKPTQISNTWPMDYHSTSGLVGLLQCSLTWDPLQERIQGMMGCASHGISKRDTPTDVFAYSKR